MLTKALDQYMKNLHFILEIKNIPPKIAEVPIFHNPKLQPTYEETLETMTLFHNAKYRETICY